MFFTKPAKRSPWDGDLAVDSTAIAAQDDLETATLVANPVGMTAETTLDDEDQAQLAALGFQSEFKRDMSLWANFSLGFTYLSPVVGIYTVFAIAITTAGPPMIWSLLIAGVGRPLVALVFSEVVTHSPSRVASIRGRGASGAANAPG